MTQTQPITANSSNSTAVQVGKMHKHANTTKGGFFKHSSFS